MKIDNTHTPKSSFLSMEKDLNLIVNKLLDNERLKRLLYYTSKDCLSQPNLTKEQTIGLFNKNIKITPKIKIDPSVLNYIVINFDDFTVNNNNPEFRNNIVEFDIICHNDQWQLTDFQLRPYKIAAEIDSMFSGKRLTGIGTLEFLGCSIEVLTASEYSGLCLMYQAIHGEEDKRPMANPNDEEQFLKDFKDMFKDK